MLSLTLEIQTFQSLKKHDFIPNNEGKAGHMGIVPRRPAEVRVGLCRSFLVSASASSVKQKARLPNENEDENG